MTTQPEELSQSATSTGLDTRTRDAVPGAEGGGTPPDLPALETDGEAGADSAADPGAVIGGFLAGRSGGVLNDFLTGIAAEVSVKLEEDPEFAEAWQAASRKQASRKQASRKRLREEEAGPSTPRPPARGKEELKALRAQLASAFEEARSQAWEGKPLGSAQGGRFARNATFLSRPAPYEGRRAQQFLRQVCVRLYTYAMQEARVKKVTEVQALFVADRIVFAANESIRKQMIAQFKADEHDNLLNLLAYPPPDSADKDADVAEARDVDMWNVHEVALEVALGEEEEPDGRLAHVLDTTEDDEELLNDILDALEGGASAAFAGGGVDEAAAWLRDDATAGGVFWCDPAELGGKAHAEQALAVVLARSGLTSRAMITGTMRPCVGCYLTLRYGIEKLGLNLAQPSGHPGGFWKTTQIDGFIAMLDEDYQASDLTTVHRAAEEFVRFMTENFPGETYATAMSPGDGEKRVKAPPKRMRRMATRSLSEYAAGWRAQQKQQAGQAELEVEAVRRDEEEEEEEEVVTGKGEEKVRDDEDSGQ